MIRKQIDYLHVDTKFQTSYFTGLHDICFVQQCGWAQY